MTRLNRRDAVALVRSGRVERLRELADLGDRQARRQLAAWLARTGRIDELRTRVDTGDRYARRQYADWLVRRKRFDEAIDEMLPLADPEDVGACQRLARLLAGRGRVEEALSVLDRLPLRHVNPRYSGEVAGWLGSQHRVDLLLPMAAAGNDSARNELAWSVRRLWWSARVADAVELLAGFDVDDEYLVDSLVRTAREEWRFSRLALRDRAIDLLGTVDDPVCRRVRAGLLLAQGRRDEAIAELRSQADKGDEVAARELADEMAREQPAWELRTLDRFTAGYTDAVAFGPDGSTLAVCDAGAIVLWHARTGARLGEITTAFAEDVAFRGDGAIITDRAVWAPHTGERLRELDLGQPSAVAVSPDDRLLATTSRYTSGGEWGPGVSLWDLTTGERVRELDTGDTIFFTGLAFGPGGQLLAVASRSWVWLFDTSTGEPVRRVGDSGAVAVAFHPGGTLLATSGVRLWDPATGTLVRTLDTAADALAFSPDGRFLATAGARDGVVRMWDVTSLRQKASRPD